MHELLKSLVPIAETIGKRLENIVRLCFMI